MELSYWKLLIALVTALICSSAVTNAQSRIGTKSLILSTEIIGREQSKGNVVEMNLRLRFVNVGDRPLILHRRSLLLVEIGVFEDIERPTADTFAQVSAMSYVPHPYSYISYHKMRGRRPSKDFIIIGRGQTYEMQEQVAAPLRPRNIEQVKKAVDDRYLLIVSLSTWDASRQRQAARLRRRWSRIGRLWSETIESEPISFVVKAANQKVNQSEVERLSLPPNNAMQPTRISVPLIDTLALPQLCARG